MSLFSYHRAPRIIDRPWQPDILKCATHKNIRFIQIKFQTKYLGIYDHTPERIYHTRNFPTPNSKRGAPLDYLFITLEIFLPLILRGEHPWIILLISNDSLVVRLVQVGLSQVSLTPQNFSSKNIQFNQIKYQPKILSVWDLDPQWNPLLQKIIFLGFSNETRWILAYCMDAISNENIFTRIDVNS